MRSFQVIVRKPGQQAQRFYAIAPSASLAYESAAATQGDGVFGITVVPV